MIEIFSFCSPKCKYIFSGSKFNYGLSVEESFKVDSWLDEPDTNEIKLKEYHPYIQRSFTFKLPVVPSFQARFKAPYSMNHVFYGSESSLTAIYETAYHFMRVRMIENYLPPIEEPRLFLEVKYNNNEITDISDRSDLAQIMDKNNYNYSHQFIKDHPDIKNIRYPSCRDPERGMNIATFEIDRLGKQPSRYDNFYFAFHYNEKFVVVKDSSNNEREILWSEVS